MSHTETRFAQELKSTPPAPLPQAFAQTLLETLSATPFPDQKNIVSFPHQPAPAPATRRQHRSWAAAAAVAIAGALAALMIPQQQQTGPSVANTIPTPATEATPRGNHFLPAGFNRGLADASDEGVIWQNDSQPHRVLRVVYMDRVTLKDQNGQSYHVEQPRVEYIIVPAKTD